MKSSSIRKSIYSAGSWGAVTLAAALSMAVLSTARAQTAGAPAAPAGKPPMMSEGGHGEHGGHGGHPGMRGMQRGQGDMMAGGLPERALWAIDATPEQRAKLKSLGESFQLT